MTDADLSFAAHILLWGFPLAMTVIALISAIRGGDRSGESR